MLVPWVEEKGKTPGGGPLLLASSSITSFINWLEKSYSFHDICIRARVIYFNHSNDLKKNSHLHMCGCNLSDSPLSATFNFPTFIPPPLPHSPMSHREREPRSISMRLVNKTERHSSIHIYILVRGEKKWVRENKKSRRVRERGKEFWTCVWKKFNLLSHYLFLAITGFNSVRFVLPPCRVIRATRGSFF